MNLDESSFQITKDVYDLCSAFADASINTSADKYASRNQFDVEKIKKDIRNGKIAEEYVWLILSKYYVNHGIQT
jgi:hypothetical protein